MFVFVSQVLQEDFLQILRNLQNIIKFVTDMDAENQSIIFVQKQEK